MQFQLSIRAKKDETREETCRTEIKVTRVQVDIIFDTIEVKCE